jgi:peptidoglycan/xylan/chitin deacetylase (PgdA/CDA1 family)
LIAATATFALNAGLWFRRGRLAIVFSSLAASCRCCAENPLIPAVQILGTTSDRLEEFSGKRPVGWLGPGLTQTYETPELLAEAGVKYIGDWVYDDEPTVIKTGNGPLVTLPYSVELNDIPTMIVQHHESEYWQKKCCDQFDRLWQEGSELPRIMALAIHPYISGQPHRIKYLEEVYTHINSHEGVLHWNGEQIYDWYNGQHKVHA